MAKKDNGRRYNKHGFPEDAIWPYILPVVCLVGIIAIVTLSLAAYWGLL